MAFSQPFDDTFRQEVEVITRDSTLSDNALHSDAERYLQVLAHPSFGDIDQPAWVRRIQRFSTRLLITYTSSKLFDALYHTADELGLATGKRYVSATICVCASGAENVATSPEDRPRRLAEALSQLASAWMAYMLWPFFVDGAKSAEEVLTRLPQISEGMASQGCNGRRLVVKEDLLKRCGYVCFMSGYLYSYAPLEFFQGPEIQTISYLQVTHIVRPPCAMREHGMRDDDEVITSDILKHYCNGPICADIVEATEGETYWQARNSLVMAPDSCSTFHRFRWCLHPGQVANQYHVKIHERNWFGAQYAASPSPVTFENHSHEYTSPSDTPPSAASPSSSCENAPPTHAHGGLQRSIDLPCAELLRVHAALAGAMQLSGALKLFETISDVCELVDEGWLPGASGSTFLQSVVAYEGREVCSDVEMRGMRVRVVRAMVDESDSDSDWD